nr:uncharacterized protein LOC117983944 [Maniola hyperantus]
MRSLLAYYADAVMSAAARGAGCARECSGHGDCMNGTCLCEIRYTGDECAGHNMPYHACIGGLFLLVAFVCAMQLTICIVSEYRRLKAPTFLRACKVTTQKMLYLIAFLASLIRGAYFVSPNAFHEGWATSLLSAYYPLMMSGSSLIVCFWAEVFHLRDIRWERQRFLSKSFLAFVTFNLISYSLLAAEVLTTNVASTSPKQKNFYQHVFNGCYAVLFFIVVVFFLIYGVEVYFKLRGEFLKETKVCTIVSPRPGPSTAAEGDDVQDTLVTKQGIQTDLASDGSVDPRSVNHSQLHQSRLGLVSQALMLILIVGFLASETLSEFWKAKVPVGSRNWHDLVFRIVEIGVALWFPCVLWNCMAPERLWLLNPRRLLARQLDDARLADLLAPHRPANDAKVVVEIGVALWFPCVLWNCMAPERLWLLNPRRLLARQLDDARLADLLSPHRPANDVKVVVEIGVALWFPCMMWNCMAPERLWLHNPRRLLARQLDDARLADLLSPHRPANDVKVVVEIGVALWFPCMMWNCMAPERLWLHNPRRLLARQLDDARLADLLSPHRPANDVKVVVEIGVALWFPCVMWNCMAPERLWLLNPRRLYEVRNGANMYADLTPQILAQFARLSWREKALLVLGIMHHWRFSIRSFLYAMSLYTKPVKSIAGSRVNLNVETDSLVGSVGSSRDCWICYDSARQEPLITPCRCTGDVAAVHHDCLRRWLVEWAAWVRLACWICYDSARQEPLITPCRCTGDVAAVHHDCLRRWLVEWAAWVRLACWICYDSARQEPLITPCRCTGDVAAVHHDCLRRWLVEWAAWVRLACWICYDSARQEPLITPCRCTGDVAAVHHDCLRRWLVEWAAWVRLACWICYDSARQEPLITPCRCTGDVAAVHHDCLRRWLVEWAAWVRLACWICYDSARQEPLITPCRCTGDVAAVHHDCLRRWLVEWAAWVRLACWICYDSARQEPLITPCRCTGDVAAVHHDCLRRWLVEWAAWVRLACWICYDSARQEPLITPCRCTGDVAAVHHDCLRRWLVEWAAWVRLACWICYDSARQEPLITPCRCTGDVAAVHHDCLRRWLVESGGRGLLGGVIARRRSAAVGGVFGRGASEMLPQRVVPRLPVTSSSHTLPCIQAVMMHDVAAVHHDCLRRWLVECSTNSDGLKCKVCNTPYIVQETNKVEWERGFTCAHWVRTVLGVACVCGAAGAAWALVQLFPSPVPRLLAAGTALIICYVALQFLAKDTATALQRAKVSSLRILTESTDASATDQTQLSTISRTVTVEIASKTVLEQALKGDVK